LTVYVFYKSEVTLKNVWFAVVVAAFHRKKWNSGANRSTD